MLYFAYGSNLDKRQMRHRAPGAKPLGKFMMMNARLVFRLVADIIPEEGSFVLGALYRLTAADLAQLDQYEGVAGGTYIRERVELPGLPGGETHVIVYRMTSRGIMPPTAVYLERIKRGYHDFGLSIGALHAAVERAHDDRKLSHVERQRWRRSGRPTLAMRPSLKVTATVEKQKGGKSKKHHKKAKGHGDEFVYRTRRNITNLTDYLEARRSGGYAH